MAKQIHIAQNQSIEHPLKCLDKQMVREVANQKLKINIKQ